MPAREISEIHRSSFHPALVGEDMVNHECHDQQDQNQVAASKP